MRAPGARSYDLVDAALDALGPDIAEPTVGWDQASGRWYAFTFDQIATETMDPAVAYPAGDTVWVIQADWQDDDWWQQVEATIQELPAQSGPIEPDISLTQRIEVPELDIAAAFPPDWTIESPPPTPDGQEPGRWAERIGIDAPDVVALHAEGPKDPRLSGPPACSLALYGPTEQTPSEIADPIRREFERCSIADEPRAGMLRARTYPGDCHGPSAGFNETFAFGSGEMVAYLTCWSKDPPVDRGPAIAESGETERAYLLADSETWPR